MKQESALLRNILFEKVLKFIEERILSFEEVIKSIRSTEDFQAKSSAGDKHETGAALIHLELEKNGAHLSEAVRIKTLLLSMISQSEKKAETIIGSVIFTNNGNFFISVSAGKVTHNNSEFYCISSASPIAEVIAKAAKGSKVHFQGREYEILEKI